MTNIYNHYLEMSKLYINKEKSQNKYAISIYIYNTEKYVYDQKLEMNMEE